MDSTPIDPANSLDALAQLARGTLSASIWTTDLAAALRALCSPSPPPDEALILLPGPQAGLTWHIDQLDALLGAAAPSTATPGPLDLVRIRYHARMLGMTLAPGRVDFRPLVTILIPVFNRAGPVVEAVQSCLEQTWRPIEIVVVDDGSTDHPEAGLARFGDAVRLIRKPNAGVASARNLGIAQATGDFIHFLDSDDMLTPRAIESKIAAFAAAADTELCYGQTRSVDMRVSPPAWKDQRMNAIADPNRAMFVGFAFLLQASMLPRWRMLIGPKFDESLRRSSDFRFWQELALAQAKVVGTRELGLHFRRYHDSLHRTPETEDDSHALGLLLGLVGLARHPHAWRCGGDYLNIMTAPRVHHWFATARSPRVQAAMTDAIAALDETARGKPSSLPMFAAMAAHRTRLKASGQWPESAVGSVYQHLSDAITRGGATATPLDDADMRRWRQTLRKQDRHLLQFFSGIAGAKSPAPLADLLLRGKETWPRRRTARRAARLQRWIGTRLAAWGADLWTRW